MPDTDPHSLAQALARIHQVITRGVAVARERSHAYANGEQADASVTTGLADYLQTLASVLHAHHDGEEEIAFPALQGRFPDAPWELLVQEHRMVVRVLADLGPLVEPIRQQPSPETWAETAEALDRLDGLWGPHHQREEEYFSYPTVNAVVPSDEQAAIAAKLATHGQQHAGPDYLVVPFLLYNLEGEERRAMASAFPPVVTEQLVPVAWRDKWSTMGPFLLA